MATSEKTAVQREMGRSRLCVLRFVQNQHVEQTGVLDVQRLPVIARVLRADLQECDVRGMAGPVCVFCKWLAMVEIILEEVAIVEWARIERASAVDFHECGRRRRREILLVQESVTD